MTTAAPSSEHYAARDSLRRIAVETRASLSTARNFAADQDASSADLSPISLAYSRNSIATTGMPEEEEPLPNRQSCPIDPAPAYSLQVLETDGLRHQMPSRNNRNSRHNNANHSYSYYTSPYAAPATPGEAGLVDSEFFAADPNQRRRRRCCCLSHVNHQPTSQNVRFVLLMLAFTMLLTFVSWCVFVRIFDYYS